MSGADDPVQELVRARGLALKRYAYLLCGDEDRADDLVQEAMTRVLSRRYPRDPAELERYVRRVLLNLVVDHSRRARVWALIKPLAAYDQRGHRDPQAEVCDRVWAGDLLGRLPPRQRACLVLRYYEDLPVAVIADLLACSEGTVKSQLHDARRALARFRDEHEHTGDTPMAKGRNNR